MIIQNNINLLPQRKMSTRQTQPSFNGLGKITSIEYHQLGEEHISALKKFIPNLEDLRNFFLEKGIIDENNNLLKRAKKIIIEDGVDQLPKTITADKIIMTGGEQENLIGDSITLSGNAKLTKKAAAKEIRLEENAENNGYLLTHYMELAGKSKNNGHIDSSGDVKMLDDAENHGTILSNTLQMWGASKNMETGIATNNKAWMVNNSENRGQIDCVDTIEISNEAKNTKTGKIKTDYLLPKDKANNEGAIYFKYANLNNCVNNLNFPQKYHSF